MKLHDGLTMRAIGVLSNAGIRSARTTGKINREVLKAAIELKASLDGKEPYAMLRTYRHCGHQTAMELLKFAGIKTPSEKKCRCPLCGGKGWVKRKSA